jgi:hypothetical protein
MAKAKAYNLTQNMLVEKRTTYQLQMRMELFFHGKLDCSVLDVHSSQPNKIKCLE